MTGYSSARGRDIKREHKDNILAANPKRVKDNICGLVQALPNEIIRNESKSGQHSTPCFIKPIRLVLPFYYPFPRLPKIPRISLAKWCQADKP